MMPETWVPTSTSVTGSTVPVAITELRIVMRLVAAVCSVMSSVRGERSQSHAPQTTATAASAARSVFFRFMFMVLSFVLSIFGVGTPSLVDVEQLDVEQRHVLGLQHLLAGGRQLVLGRQQLDGVLHPDGELLARQLVAAPGVLLLLDGRDVLRLGRQGVEVGPLDLLEQRLLQVDESD